MQTSSEKRRISPTPQTAVNPNQSVANRDIPLLMQIYYIMQEVESLEMRSQWQYDRLYSITKRITGMPGGGGLPQGIDATLAALEEINEQYAEQIRTYTAQLKAAERILNGIPSETMRAFVRMYYVDRIKKADIMRELDMTEWGFNRARRSVEQADCMANVIWREWQIIGA